MGYKIMDFKTRLAKLIDVKTIVTFTLVGAITHGFIARYVSVEVFVPLVTAVITYFFTRKDNKTGGDAQ